MGRTRSVPEIELNTCNVCGGDCFICARAHGSGNAPIMNPIVFNEFLKQLKDIEVEQIQTNGNGDCFLNPHFLDYVTAIRKANPGTTVWNYSNFQMLTPQLADRIIDNHLFDKMHVRLDSMDTVLFEKSQRMNPEIVFDNIEYFIKKNAGKIPFTILYMNLNDYFDKCKKVLGQEPHYNPFTKHDKERFRNEEPDIKAHFSFFGPITTCRISPCLWAEREFAQQDKKTPCPKLDIIEKCLWVSPDGSLQVCCYDDRQADFTYGNIMENHMYDLWTGPKRRDIINHIKARKYTEMPCRAPKCCAFEDL